MYIFFIQENVSNDLVSQPNASGPPNVTWQPSQHNELIGTIMASFSDLYFLL
jgi:hypothetical protein